MAVLMLCGTLCGLYYLIFRTSMDGVGRQAEQILEARAGAVRSEVRQFLATPVEVANELRVQSEGGLLAPGNVVQLERFLFGAVLFRPELLEATFTRPDGLQVSVLRDPEGRVETALTEPKKGKFVRRDRLREVGGAFDSVNFGMMEFVGDPTEHATYRTPARRGRNFWTDLHWSHLDTHLPQEKRRVVLSALQPLQDQNGELVGVIKVSLSTERLNQQMAHSPDRHHLFLCDPRGRLIATTQTAQQPQVQEDDELRYPHHLAEVEQASKLAAGVEEDGRFRSGSFEQGGRTYLATLVSVDEPGDETLDTWDWALGIVVAEEVYSGPLRASWTQGLAIMGVAFLLLFLGGTRVLGWLRDDLGRMRETTQELERFRFEATEHRPHFPDSAEVLAGLESAKTVVRSMGKYLPMELVEQLYALNREPRLGGESRYVTLMFTDVEGFTTLAEGLDPDRLARCLGLYFQAMAGPILEHEGVIDKFIGDAVMAMWNAPREVENHEVKACRAAWACHQVVSDLFQSNSWEGNPPLPTRFGLHCATVMVGHFGAPERMDYTSLGDGVNLAARLEGLNKVYGTRILVSQAVVEQAAGSFCFRKLDKVAVKGKVEGITVYELVGELGQGLQSSHRLYEEALELYFQGAFQEASDKLEERRQDDPPSQVLYERCGRFLESPPPPDWDGTYQALSK